jgi:hypothetical protein
VAFKKQAKVLSTQEIVKNCAVLREQGGPSWSVLIGEAGQHIHCSREKYRGCGSKASWRGKFKGRGTAMFPSERSLWR